ncbi:MAG: hypothetical protein AAFR17_10530 [Pseudomonadota bacterium]
MTNFAERLPIRRIKELRPVSAGALDVIDLLARDIERGILSETDLAIGMLSAISAAKLSPAARADQFAGFLIAPTGIDRGLTRPLAIFALSFMRRAMALALERDRLTTAHRTYLAHVRASI